MDDQEKAQLERLKSSQRTAGPMPFGRAPGMQGPVEKAKDFRKSLATIVGYLRPFRGAIIAVLFFAVTSTAFSIVSPKILGWVTNDIVSGYVNAHVYDALMQKLAPGQSFPEGTTGGQLLQSLPAGVAAQIPPAQANVIRTMDISRRPHIDYREIFGYVELLALLYLVSALLSYIQGWIMTDVSQKVTFNLRRDISEKINRLPLSYFDKRTFGDVLSRVTNDVDTVGQTLNQSLTQVVTSVTLILGILIMMLSISWQLTLVALIVLPVSGGLIALTVKKSQSYFIAQQVELGSLNSHVEEMFSGHVIMRAFGGEERSIKKFSGINEQIYESGWKSQFFSGLLYPVMIFVGNLGYVGVAVLGGILARGGSINIGDIQAFIQYMSQFTQPIAQTANVASVLQSTAAAAERVFEFLDEPEQSAEIAEPVKLAKVRGAVEFRDVHFGYSSDKPIIKGFTTSVKPGERIAIVGPTGAGKTTIVNLLMRFYDVTSGSISIDGVDVRDMRRPDVRSLFGMVLQDTWLFTGSIENNIAYGKQKTTREEIVAAGEAAHADHFIRALPGGYGMQLNEAADNISQGEKQLLTIARAMLADAPMLILDEATSSVDTRTEALIQAAMERLMKGRTSFVIAHRLSTIKNADKILVMRDGNIVEQGNHEALIAQNGFYAALYNSQFANT